jgi:putative transposase
MAGDLNPHDRRSIRLKNYDYTQSGAYFVTICTINRIHLFGEIIDGEMSLNPAGGMVKTIWHEIPAHYSYVEIDAFVIMPNHIHRIIILLENHSVGAVKGDRPKSGKP